MLRLVFSMCLIVAVGYISMAQETFYGCRGMSDSTYTGPASLVEATQNLVLVCVDFENGRLANGEPPSDPEHLALVNWDAVGSLGWVLDNSIPPQLVPKIRKYRYEDYWDRLFSDGEWVDERHPDFDSHDGYSYTQRPPLAGLYDLTLYGSVRDYWDEVSYGNLTIAPHPTRIPNDGNKLNTGIVNNYDQIDGENYIRWIQLPEEKAFYEGRDELTSHIRARLIELNNLPESHPDYIQFDIEWYEQNLGAEGSIAVWGAGGGPEDGDHFGGYAQLQWYFVSEKFFLEPNNDPESIFEAILGDAHEFGHTLGFKHYQGLGNDLMHSGGLAGFLWHSPPHLNPWEKIREGWITEEDIVRVPPGISVSLPPIHSPNPKVAVITVYGDPGYDNEWTLHSEYFIVEYRSREGFNRFTGGKVTPGFEGGALVWHYTSMGEFPITGSFVVRQLGLKIENYGDPPSGWFTGDPDHFYPYHGTTLDQITVPNSNSVDDLITGISLNDFTLEGGLAEFDVDYELGTPPDYYMVFHTLTNTSSITALSGNVYLQRLTWPTLASIAAGTHIDLAPSITTPREFHTWSVQAIGTSTNPIVFDGVGYGSHRIQWRGTYSSSADAARLEECRINNAEIGINVIASAPVPTTEVESCVFSNCEIDMKVLGATGTNTFDASRLDGNVFSLMVWQRYVKVDAGNLTIPAGSTLRLEEFGSLPSIIVSERTLQFSGTLDIQSNATIKGNAFRFLNHVTIPTGMSLTIKPNSTLEFSGGKRLDVKGTLIAEGSEPNSIQFTKRSDISGNWTGINIEGTPATSATLANVQIDHCNTAVRVRSDAEFSMDGCTIADAGIGVDLYTASQDPPFVTITNSVFSDVSNGIIVDNYTDLLIENNTITGTSTEELTAGISCFTASPKILGNTVQSFARGVRCFNASSPLLENVIPGGYNVIINNGTGVYCKDQSNAILGLVGGGLGDEGGQNSIYSNSSYAAQLVNNCNVRAEKNWWGTSNPTQALFLVDGTSDFDYKPFLTLDPNSEGMKNVGQTTAGNESTEEGGAPPTSNPNGGGIGDAILARLEGRLEDASDLLQEVVGSRTTSRSTREWAVAELLAVTQGLPQTGISDYLLSAREDYPSLARTIDFVIPHAYLDEGDNGGAMTAFTSNIAQYPSSELERNGLYGKFLNALYTDRDSTQAESILATLEAGYPESDEAYVSRLRFEDFTIGERSERMGPAINQTTVLVPAAFRLHQNYPNPFNPSTTIKYDLPADANVSLKVYDMLGREVLSLVDGFETAGYHQITADGSNLASGVYFYRIRAGSFTHVKKLMLLK